MKNAFNININIDDYYKLLLAVTILVLGSFLFLGTANAQEIPGLETLRLPGTVEDEGTHFEITDSGYLNVALDTTEPIKLRMESMPEMVTMMIEPSVSTPPTTTSTQITLSGFNPNTTYYKYEDDYHNLTEFTADANGAYSYIQDISQLHIVFIQPRAGTKFIKDDATGGDCYLIGNWDASTKTCTLTTDVYETIQIDSDYITFDGNGHTITGSNTGNGVYLSGKSDVTIKNLNARNFEFGIRIYYSDNVVISNISSINNRVGVTFTFSSYSTLSDSFIQAGLSPYITVGVSVGGDPNVKNKIIRNIITDTNYFGISISYSDDTLIENNTLLNNRNWGIGIYSENTIISNNFISGSYTGIYNNASYNKIFYNTIQARHYSIKISSGYSIIYNNNFYILQPSKFLQRQW